MSLHSDLFNMKLASAMKINVNFGTIYGHSVVSRERLKYYLYAFVRCLHEIILYLQNATLEIDLWHNLQGVSPPLVKKNTSYK